MNKKILLIEPEYKNKYPPLGLMKISAYHKLKGDNVTFYKGCSVILQEQRWDRIYVTTLFSFHWKKTIKTILFYKRSVKKSKNLFIGGILATTMYDEIINDTGIIPIKGLLDKPGLLGNDNIIVDHLTPDYDILDKIEYNYPTSNSYITYMTRGCCNKCSFCAVPLLEPKYSDYLPIKKQIAYIDEHYGIKKDLLLMDNNVLASNNFDKIIDDIKNLGFEKGAKYQEPNYLELYLKRLNNNNYDQLLIEKTINLLTDTLERRIKVFEIKELFFQYLVEFDLLTNEFGVHGKKYHTRLKKAFPFINEIYDKYRNKSSKSRYIDFNQGIDARLLTEEKMKRLSEINIRPLRIAFDDIKYRNIYEEKIRLAAKYDIKDLSNYILYNYKDTPEDLYKRLKINIELNEELDLRIFSFPMKYIPIKAKDRTHIGGNWNRKYLRTVQAILNVVHGAVMPKRNFFEKAFGQNLDEFMNLLIMPEDYVYYRFYAENLGLNKIWKKQFDIVRENLNGEFSKVEKIIHSNTFNEIEKQFENPEVLKLLEHYKNRIKLKEYKEWKINNNH